jgi:arylsulfatase
LDDALPKRVPVEAGYPPLIYEKQFVPPQNMLAKPK